LRDRSEEPMQIADTIRRKLTAGLAPLRLDIVDESHKHAGHAGWRPGGETHFRVEVVAAAFEAKSRVARQRMVYDLLAEELADRVHALALKTLTPAEDRAR
jgi:BolA protein